MVEDRLVVGVVLIDADGSRARIMRVVERADGGLALVLNLLAVLQQGEASLVGIAFLALGGSGDGRHIGLDGLAIGTAALLCGERGEDDAIVGFSAVGGGVFQVDAGGFEALDEVVGRIDTCLLYTSDAADE